MVLMCILGLTHGVGEISSLFMQFSMCSRVHYKSGKMSLTLLIVC